jgi:phosphoribosylaminoimidazole-succinocarboxamide synthase
VASTSDVLTQTDLPGVPLRARGKVRDIYEVDDRLLLVTTDRISAFDYILPTGIPQKGEVLNRLSLFWFDFLRETVDNHVVTADVNQYPPELRPFADQLRGRSVLVKRAEMVQLECVARGYLSGSGWKEYLGSGSVCGIKLPAGLQESSRLPEPIFTPATKAESGHDINISFEQACAKLGEELVSKLRDLTLTIYHRAAAYAETKGIIIADTKFEFGNFDGKLILADEVLTPDSSRFWPEDQYRPGGPQPSYDKQFVRDHLEAIHWNKQPPAPALPADVARRTSEKYREGYRLLTGHDL